MKSDSFPQPGSSKNRSSADAQAIRYPSPWARNVADRRKQFNDWRYIAMQVLRIRSGPFSVLAILDQLFDIEAGECVATNEAFAFEAGHCSVRTVIRELNALRSFGLITAETAWLSKDGKNVKGRRIRLSIPIDLTGVHLR